MNNRDTHFVLTAYEPGIPCDCKANAYEWRFCEKHKAIEDARHADALRQHVAESMATDWIYN